MTGRENGILPRESISGNQGKGSYVLLMQLAEEQRLAIGRLKDVRFPPGQYAYIGSAMSGFKRRVGRHLKEDKRRHWHIDYLLPRAIITGIVLCPTPDRAECTIARALSRQFPAIPRFGSSDCKCLSHLFFADGTQMKSHIMSTINRLGMKPRLVSRLADEKGES